MVFLRYPGGKSKFLKYLVHFLPINNEIAGKYVEPFVGGGAVYLYVKPQEALISDLNGELIELYKGIKLYPHKVWEIFKDFPSGKESYYEVRDGDYRKKPLYYRAARTLYLNRTCFKGMWRHNPQGNFNVGYGGEERRWVITHENIKSLSQIFRKADITNCDFEQTLSNVKNGDFIFIDPPYKPGEKEMNTQHYINGRFAFCDQIRLAEKIDEISNRLNIKWLMTNSNNEDITNLYKNYTIRKIPKGVSSSIGISTKDSKEVLISNY